MGDCQNCVYFRSIKPKSQLLKQAIPSTDAQISNSLKEILKDESEQQGYEAQLKREKSHNNDENWDMSPVMSSYCAYKQVEGNEAEKDTYLICEVKNIGGRCTHFKEGIPTQRTCQTCANRSEAKGMERDNEGENRLSQAGQVNVVVGLSTSTTDNLLSKHLEGANSRKSLEISIAYHNQGHLFGNPPDYLDYCGALSQQGNYVACAFQNSHSDCPHWRDSESKVTSPITPASSSSFKKFLPAAAVAGLALGGLYLFSKRSRAKRETDESNEQKLTEQELEPTTMSEKQEKQAAELQAKLWTNKLLHNTNIDIIKRM